MEFSCSLCGYKSDTKKSVARHIDRKVKCKEGIPTIIDLVVKIECQYCNKEFTTSPNLKKHLKTCKNKKEILEEKIKNLEDKLKISEDLCKYTNEINRKYEDLKKVNENNEKIIESIVKTSTKKILGNTPVESIRSQARKKYKELFKNMKCVHCKHDGSTQVCHIKAISEFDKFSEVEEINKMSNLIGLCPNCHIDLDKHKKFEVTRTAMLHSMFIQC